MAATTFQLDPAANIAVVNGGGSTTTVVYFDKSFIEVGRRKGPSFKPGVKDMGEGALLADLVMDGRPAFMSVDEVIVGMAGMGSHNVRKVFLNALSSRLTALDHESRIRISVRTDLELAIAILTCYKPGIVLIAGTGSVAACVDASGVIHQCGGKGSDEGDEGSGYWIGRRAADLSGITCTTISETAALAEKVIALAAQSPGWQRQLVSEAVSELVSLAERCIATLGNVGYTIPLFLTGGVATSPYILNEMMARLCNEYVLVQAVPDILSHFSSRALTAWRNRE